MASESPAAISSSPSSARRSSASSPSAVSNEAITRSSASPISRLNVMHEHESDGYSASPARESSSSSPPFAAADGIRLGSQSSSAIHTPSTDRSHHSSPSNSSLTYNSEGTLAKRGSNGYSQLKPSTTLDTPQGRAYLDGEEEEALLTDEDLSIENYMRRHPCVLDKGSAFMDRHSWIYQAIVVALITLGVITGSLIAFELGVSDAHKAVAYLYIAVQMALFVYTCRRSPGIPAKCPDESSVIQLLHGWPATSHHYGLHASEWSRSWSYCMTCRNWRPARSHHCSRCQTCVLMMDHHCIWIGQCVGANNIRQFFAYVGSMVLLTSYGLILAYQYVYTQTVSFNLFLFLFFLIIVLCGFCAASYLSIRCFWLMLHNETGIEGLKKSSYVQKQREEKMRQTGQSSNILTKEKMLKHPGNGSEPAPKSSNQNHAQVVAFQERVDGQIDSEASPDVDTASTSSPLFFSPFQCACHAASFRVYYCQSFNYPSLRASLDPIPPLPFYYDYGSPHGEWTLNWWLFWEDCKRMERFHDWSMKGAIPIKTIGKHMRMPDGMRLPAQGNSPNAEPDDNKQLAGAFDPSFP